MTKKRKTDDVFKIYRSAVKQYPILRMVVATKCVEYLHQFELAQHYYNNMLVEKHEFLKRKIGDLTTKIDDVLRLDYKRIEENLEAIPDDIIVLSDHVKDVDDDSFTTWNRSDLKVELNKIQVEITDTINEKNKAEEEFQNIDVNGKSVQLDFSEFIVTDTIIGNTFEIGLVTDERLKGDVVGRKGILAADLRKREILDEDDDGYDE